MPTEPQDAFDRLTGQFLTNPRVQLGRMFGATALKLGGTVFAMLVKGNLVVKLPASEAGDLVDAGVGAFFDPGHENPMWPRAPLQLLPLAVTTYTSPFGATTASGNAFRLQVPAADPTKLTGQREALVPLTSSWLHVTPWSSDRASHTSPLVKSALYWMYAT